MDIKTKFHTLVAAVSIGLASCSQPTIEKLGDLTGDGIPDIIIDIREGFQHGKWLFIGQEDGSYIRAKRHDAKNSEIKYYRTEDGQVYFFDGQIYKSAPKQE